MATATRTKTIDWKALVKKERKKQKEVEYEFSNGKKFYRHEDEKRGVYV